SVDHDVVLADHVVVSPGAIISGAVKVGRGAFVGAGAVIIQGIEIGEYCIIGAGAVVRHNTKPNTTVVGNPAAQLE
ncbi:MAG: acetyltransferase, partial [Actinobacteria bacterium]|nr:acetyltransferase [Actinomycetota bacterium]